MTANERSGEMRRCEVWPGWDPALENSGCAIISDGRDISHGILC